MGLSDEERIRGVYSSVRNVMNHLTELKIYKVDELADIVKHCDGIWPALLSSSRNTICWFSGTGLDSTTIGCSNPWHMALQYLGNELHEEQDLFDHVESEAREYIKFRMNYGPSIQKTLNNKAFELVYRINEDVTRCLSYYINRYEDELADGLKNLVIVLSNILGSAYMFFTTQPDYLRAYLCFQLWNKVMTHEVHDVVNQWIRSHGIQDHMRLHDDLDVKDLLTWWTDFQFRDPDIEERLVMALRLLGRRYHYSHQHAQLRTMIDHHHAVSDSMINMMKVEPLLAECISRYDEDNRNMQEQHDPECELTGQSRRYPIRGHENKDDIE